MKEVVFGGARRAAGGSHSEGAAFLRGLHEEGEAGVLPGRP